MSFVAAKLPFYCETRRSVCTARKRKAKEKAAVDVGAFIESVTSHKHKHKHCPCGVDSVQLLWVTTQLPPEFTPGVAMPTACRGRGGQERSSQPGPATGSGRP